MSTKGNYLPGWAAPVLRWFGHIADDSEAKPTKAAEGRTGDEVAK
jgi:hypothetical protein